MKEKKTIKGKKQKGRNKEEIQSQWGKKKRDLSVIKYKSINNYLKMSLDNAPIKRQSDRLVNNNNRKPTICCVEEAHLGQRTHIE